MRHVACGTLYIHRWVGGAKGTPPCSCETETKQGDHLPVVLPQFQLVQFIIARCPFVFISLCCFFFYFFVIVSKAACECGSIFPAPHTDTQISCKHKALAISSLRMCVCACVGVCVHLCACLSPPYSLCFDMPHLGSEKQGDGTHTHV